LDEAETATMEAEKLLKDNKTNSTSEVSFKKSSDKKKEDFGTDIKVLFDNLKKVFQGESRNTSEEA
jgi:hypothetical protein